MTDRPISTIAKAHLSASNVLQYTNEASIRFICFEPPLARSRITSRNSPNSLLSWSMSRFATPRLGLRRRLAGILRGLEPSWIGRKLSVFVLLKADDCEDGDHFVVEGVGLSLVMSHEFGLK